VATLRREHHPHASGTGILEKKNRLRGEAQAAVDFFRG
jgi:hypothetical protein